MASVATTSLPGTPTTGAPTTGNPHSTPGWGGTRESWEDEHGDPIEADNAGSLSTAYDLDGYSSVEVGFHENRVTSVSLFSPRPEGEEWSDEPHGMDWTVQKAHQLARQFLPTDAALEEPREEAGYVGRTCASEALAAEVPEATYDVMDTTPVYGGCSYALFLNAEGRVGWIAIDLVVEDTGTEAEAAAPAFASGGLGLDLDAWEAIHGEGEEDAVPGWRSYDDRRYVVAGTLEGRIDHLERHWEEGEGVTFEEARAESRRLMPADAQLVETYQLPGGYTVDLYVSASLAQRFPDTVEIDGSEFSTWVGGEPGNFTVGFGDYGTTPEVDRVTWIVMAIGNNP